MSKPSENPKYYQNSSTHPGETLKEKLEELGIGPKEFAVKADKPEKTITAILNGESSITPDMAIQFERVLKIPANFWLQRQVDYDEAIARDKEQLKFGEALSWMKNFPLKEMIKLSWVPDVKSEFEKTAALFNFFGVASHKAWENYYLDQKLKVAFRISLSGTKQPEAISAWLRRGEILAESLPSIGYDKSAFEDALVEIKKIMAKHPKDFAAKLQTTALKAGVKVVYTPCLPKAPINGATRWIGDTPIIQLSGRYKRNDSFWFTFFHEAGHICKHGKKDVFLEEVDYSEKDLEKEQEANDFAEKWTLTPEQYQEVLQYQTLTPEDVNSLAKRFETHPAMIIGRLQHDGKIPFSVGKVFIEPVELN
jgi:HTH-type transcriptional regulator / antitoxin HigA